MQQTFLVFGGSFEDRHGFQFRWFGGGGLAESSVFEISCVEGVEEINEPQQVFVLLDHCSKGLRRDRVCERVCVSERVCDRFIPARIGSGVYRNRASTSIQGANIFLTGQNVGGLPSWAARTA